MAFCKFCGKEIPDGAVCGCPGSQNAAQAPVNQENGGYDPGFGQVDNQAGGAASGMKDNLPKIVAGVIALVILIVALVFVFGNTGAKGAAKKFAKSLTKTNGGKNFYSLTLTDDRIKELKDDDEWKDMIEEYNDEIKDARDDDYKLKVKDVKKGKKLNKKALKGAEYIWEEKGADDPEAKKGYEFKIKIQANDDGDKETETMQVSVVKFKGEGWKVLRYDADDLKEIGEEAEEEEEDEED